MVPKKAIFPLAVLSLGLIGALVAMQMRGVNTGTQVDATTPRRHGLSAEQAGRVLLKIGEREITAGEFAESIADRGEFLAARYNSPERRRELLEELVRFELLAAEARRLGYDQLPEVRRVQNQALIRQYLDRELAAITPESISEADCRAYYDAHPTEFHTPQQVRLSHIVVSTPAHAQRILSQLRVRSNDPGLFRALAEQNSTDEATRERFGDLGFISRLDQRTESEPNLPQAVVEAGFALAAIGDVSGAVTGPHGVHILQLTGRREAMERSFEDVKAVIRQRIFRERREVAQHELEQRLTREIPVELHLEALQQLEPSVPPTPTTEPRSPL